MLSFQRNPVTAGVNPHGAEEGRGFEQMKLRQREDWDAIVDFFDSIIETDKQLCLPDSLRRFDPGYFFHV